MPNYQKFREPIMAPSFYLTDGTALGGGGGAQPSEVASGAPAGVTLTDNSVAVQRMRITFDAKEIAILAAADFTSLDCGKFGDSRKVMVMGVTSELDIAKDGVGVTTGAALDFSMSSAAAVSSSLTLAANSDLMYKVDVNGTGDFTDYDFDEYPTLSGTTITKYPRKSLASGIFFNVQTSIIADGSVTVNGWVDIYYVDLGVAV